MRLVKEGRGLCELIAQIEGQMNWLILSHRSLSYDRSPQLKRDAKIRFVPPIEIEGNLESDAVLNRRMTEFCSACAALEPPPDVALASIS